MRVGALLISNQGKVALRQDFEEKMSIVSTKIILSIRSSNEAG